MGFTYKSRRVFVTRRVSGTPEQGGEGGVATKVASARSHKIQASSRCSSCRLFRGKLQEIQQSELQETETGGSASEGSQTETQERIKRRVQDANKEQATTTTTKPTECEG